MDFSSAIGLVDTHTPQHIIFIRLILAALFGGMIGFEREMHREGAGLRTHILIAMAACLFTLLTIELFETFGGSPNSRADPIRAVEAVTAGVAFLGAGAIFRRPHDVKGITTGAGMWLAGAVGLATALGYYIVGFVTAIFAIIVLSVLQALKTRIDSRAAPDQDEEH
ncbi:membrane protein [Youhaiella tibetensis]|uniref:Protein MgtC n=1 Tax=Paradevosia tibetensis TaxID=1447062 RepID=A0A5B9DQG0_9HYPH|nr:MgtC/SapB family protein [Youhaiella tibetensis]AKR56604.1 Membrane protein, MgtC/SapB family [Devosia sp. H5989]QEE21640.1 MgtC/SapB family protein [Youhaiella tibetensis]GGF13007.1 membrane protein [Youhaiella tibetensis]